MTTPAFNHLISIDTLSREHRLDELRQVATDLRNERTFGAPQAQRRPNRLRLAIGTALLSAGSALVASPSRTSIQTR
jgi:hypothetical protein